MTLSLFILIPCIGILLVFLLPPAKLRAGIIALTFGFFCFSLTLLFRFQVGLPGFQFQEALPWLDAIGLTYRLGVDGLSLPLVVLTTFLTWIAVLATPATLERPRLYYTMVLLATAGLMGALLAQNLLLFFLFYEIELIPFFLLISIWGSDRRQYAAYKFLIYTALSGILILAAFFGVTWLTGASTFDYAAIDTQDLPLRAKLILLTLLLVGFGIKIPLVPLHTWQPDAYVQASPAVAILLGGLLAKLGTYGLIRFGLQLFPDCWTLVSPGLAVLGSISVMYGSLTAIAQKDIKRMVAYSSIGHMGYILVAAAAGTELSLLGAIAQMVAHGLILALLFHLVGTVEAKTGTRDLNQLNGLMNPVRGLPLTSGLLVLAGMASAGIPGLVGFAAEILVFQGSFPVFPIPTIICILSSGLTAVYFVILINRTCFGRLDNKLAYYAGVSLQEQFPALVLTLTIFFLGLQPQWLIHWTETMTTTIASRLIPQTIEQIASIGFPL
ncbi:MAG: NADH-quinone oxidoreductase subunit M [Prochlorotrichaceae cyanobacterium]